MFYNTRRIIFCLCSAASALLISGCSSIFFFPTHEYVATPENLGLHYEAVQIPVGEPQLVHPQNLSAWWIPAQTPAAEASACGTVVLFHGNAQNMSNHLFGSAWLPYAGFNLLIFDYRGYGSSSGQADVPRLVADGYQVLDNVLARLDGLNNGGKSKIVVYGQSIGGALAIPVVAKYPRRERIAGTVIESSFFSYPGIVREKLGSFFLSWPFQYPLSWLFLSRYDPKSFIKEISPIPLLLVHGQDDQIVLPDNSRKLLERAEQPKELWEIPGGEHIDAFQHPQWRDKFTRYLQKLFGCNENSGPTIK